MDIRDRRTVRSSDGNAVELFYVNSFIPGIDDAVYQKFQKSLNCLTAYEDKDLPPEEVTAIMAVNERLHELLGALERALGKVRG